MLNYECALYWRQQKSDGPPHPLLFFAHKSSRLLPAVAQHKRKYSGHMSPIYSTMLQHPEYVHLFSDHVLEADSPLLNSTSGADLVKILSKKVVLLDPSRLDSYTDSNICQATGSVLALLRWAWYDTYSFVNHGRHVLF